MRCAAMDRGMCTVKRASLRKCTTTAPHSPRCPKRASHAKLGLVRPDGLSLAGAVHMEDVNISLAKLRSLSA